MRFDRFNFERIIEGVLQSGDRMYSPEAVRLLLGTCAQESGFGKHRIQIGGGPALGVFQMEPATMEDIYSNYLRYKPKHALWVLEYSFISAPSNLALENNLIYQIQMARLHYRRVKAPLPKIEDGIEGLATYWKQYYNTPKGKGKESEFVFNYTRYVGA